MALAGDIAFNTWESLTEYAALHKGVQMKKLVSVSAFYAACAWFFVFLVGGYIATGGEILSAGGGATVVALLPASIFCLSLYYLNKNGSRYSFFSAMLFWVGLVAMIVTLYSPFIQNMDHWPAGVAFIYAVFGLLAIIQAGVFVALHRFRERSSKDKVTQVTEVRTP